jgi:DNA-binding NarL/FixJ family response regulator
VKTIRVLVADDHAVVRRGLKQILGTAPDIEVAAEAGSGDEVLTKLLGDRFDVLVTDVTMPDTNAVDLIKRIRLLHPQLPILVHSMHAEGPVVSRMLKAGAAGYITKDSEPEQLLAALRKVVAGGRYIAPGVAEQLVFSDNAPEGKPLHELLSSRERQVLSLLAGGKTIGDIARDLGLSPKTASTYKTRIMEKLRVETDADLFRYTTTHQLSK